MLFFSRFKRLSGLTDPAKTSVRELLSAALKHQVCIEILFTARNRQMDNVYCRIKALRGKKVLLVSGINFLPDALNGEQCLIYFNLPHSLLVNTFKMSPGLARAGFLCKTQIIHNYLDSESRNCVIEIDLPQAYVQRSLRKHERVFPASNMVKSVDLWLRGKLPKQWREMGPSDFSFREGAPSRLRLINISASGARIEIDNVEESDRYRKLTGAQMLLCVVLCGQGRKCCAAPVVCQCVEGLYSATLRRLSLRLRFMQVWKTDCCGQGSWGRVDEDGVPPLRDWINNDFCLLTEKPSHSC
ncbi:hypothetical protein [Desulfovibrio intestinalis]|uniref:PilZ domain-containing protein n=1 Tax=Desulfovibrio intestinalis TaxID=58621 RepID=A0A7W8FFX6_9BACT|nr:hypothetical protein [Desulfovibrio intestinalis]MBB5143346.1 hypothetical protein [Desulfovibrio intestinalis]